MRPPLRRGPLAAVFLLLLLLIQSAIAEAKKSGGLFGKSKTPSRPPQHQQRPPPVSTGGYNYGRGSSSFKKPSKGFGTAKSVLAGLAAGYVGYKLTKGLSHMMYNGMNYYPGDRYYPGLSSPNKIRCEYRLSDDESNALNVTLDNSTRATTLIYECNAHSQYCCEMQCCNTNMMTGGRGHMSSSNWVGVGFGLLVTMLVVGCIGFVVFKFSRRIMDFLMPGRHRNDSFQPVDGGLGYPPDQPPPPGAYQYSTGPTYPYPPGYGAQQPGYAPAQPGYPPPQPGYPPAQPGYPPPQPGYPPQNPGYPPEQPPPYGFKS